MATLDMTRLMKDLRIRLPGALDSAIQQEMFATVNEFFQDTNVWKEDIPVTLAVGTTSYELVPTGSASINILMGVATANGLPVQATMAEPGTLVLANVPSAIDTITATVALTVVDPTDNESYPQFPAWILQKYRSDFFDGICGRMMSQPAKPYSNQQMAVYHLRRWRGSISSAKVEAQRTNLYRAQAWVFPAAGTRMTRPRR